jgi:oligopeptide/dipeptide ABC transporter ATP-binding protein
MKAHLRAGHHLALCGQCAGEVEAQGQARTALRDSRPVSMPSTLMSLLSAIPQLGQEKVEQIRLTGEPSSPIDPPATVCRFASRCPAVQLRCNSQAPTLQGSAGHLAACHFATPLAHGAD